MMLVGKRKLVATDRHAQPALEAEIKLFLLTTWFVGGRWHGLGFRDDQSRVRTDVLLTLALASGRSIGHAVSAGT